LLLFIPILENPEQQNCLALLVFVSLLWATEVLSTQFKSKFRHFLLTIAIDYPFVRYVSSHPLLSRRSQGGT
jgi:hypothetical protein